MKESAPQPSDDAERELVVNDDVQPCRERLREVFAALVAGRRDTLDEIYRLCGRELFGFALWRTGNREDATDAVQDVFLRLAGTKAALGTVRDPRAYLLAMTRRAVADIASRASCPGSRPPDPLLQADTDSPERAFDALRVSNLVAALPPKQREVLYLHHVADLSFGEIGRVLGISRFTAASRHRLGLRRLRRRLGEKP